MKVIIGFNLTLKSDYHISSGSGIGRAIDDGLVRDYDGGLSIRGTTIAGLMRQALYDLLDNPGTGYKGPWCSSSSTGEKNAYCTGDDKCPICTVFGNPQQAKCWNFSTARPVESPVASWRNLALGFDQLNVSRRVRINPVSRRAEDDKLFTRELGAAGKVFGFTVSADLSYGPHTLEDAALIVALARSVRSIGGSRRRGQGECSIHLVEHHGFGDIIPSDVREAEKCFLNIFLKRWLKGIKEASAEFSSNPPKISASSREAVRLRLLVRLDEPLLVARRPQAGNTWEQCETVPGTVILGAMAARAAAAWNLTNNENYRVFTNLFRRGWLIASHLYPAYIDEGEMNPVIYPAVPAPRDFLTCKAFPATLGGIGHQAKGFAMADHEPGLCPDCNKESSGLKALGGFIVMKRQITSYTPPRRTEMHIALDPVRGTVAGGQLFGYEVYAEGQWFIGELCCRDSTLWKELAVLLDIIENKFTLRIGKASHRGYGKVSVWASELPVDEPPLGCGLPVESRVTDMASPITMTFISDAILEDEWGRVTGALPDEYLEKMLGFKVKAIRGFCRHSVIDGFRGHTGLPRVRAMALKAGSAIGFRLAGYCDMKNEKFISRLKEIEAAGLGMRTSEGYGRVCFNHPLYGEVTRARLDWMDKLPGESPVHAYAEFAGIDVGFDPELEELISSEKSPGSLARLLISLRGKDQEIIQSELSLFGDPTRYFPGTSFPAKEQKQLGRGIIEKLADIVKQSDKQSVYRLFTRLAAELTVRECGK